jgi:hypothetical protein
MNFTLKMVKMCISIRLCIDVNDLVVGCHKIYRFHEHSYYNIAHYTM